MTCASACLPQYVFSSLVKCWFVYTIQKLAEARELARGEVNEPLDAADFECRAVISCTVNGDDRDVCVESAFLVSLCKT